jgi:hypothetical protein
VDFGLSSIRLKVQQFPIVEELDEAVAMTSIGTRSSRGVDKLVG